MKIATITICTLTTLAALATAGEAPSVERGRELFTGTALGTNGKSCATCHPDGKGVEGAAGLDEGELARVLNGCIAKSLKGKPLDPGSPEMKSLMMYVESAASSRSR